MERNAINKNHSSSSSQMYGSLDISLQMGKLNALLRQQLTPSKQAEADSSSAEQMTALKSTLSAAAVTAVAEILDDKPLARDVLHQKLSELYFLQKHCYENAEIDSSLRKRQFICQSGLIMSPDHCITTQLDDLRVRAYIRGIDKALRASKSTASAPLRIMYPACGPFAPLLMPLLAYYQANQQYSAEQLQITLVDIQKGAVLSLKALVEEMGIADYIEAIYCMDALAYTCNDNKFDVVVLEAMQHGFSREAHFAITRHFAEQLTEHGYFIPQNVSVRAMLTNGQREYVEQWPGSTQLSECDMSAEIIAQRIDLGEILSLTPQNLSALPELILDENSRLIKCGKVTIPNEVVNRDDLLLILCTRVQVYAEEWLGEYDSGITHPLPDTQVCINFKPHDAKPGDLLVKSGDKLKFYYRLNGLPGFMATSVE
ncbi:MAG: hypothetical protein QNK26_07620 [Moritella sp.]|uniref:hypothetical protein n=1 Tax=Moritella sp. TaxID=78556 RepID=UPI0029BFA615|nr:hypothetical protein [Moritella sp.]MDX2320452.1 hypothetical protein [Moritella sp.]